MNTDCGFCHGEPVGNAGAWSDKDEPKYAPCPRCGQCPCDICGAICIDATRCDRHARKAGC
jgi:hypothetical protein